MKKNEPSLALRGFIVPLVIIVLLIIVGTIERMP